MRIIEKAINHYGLNNQLIVTIEELSELQKELCKALRRIPDRDHIVEEYVDCLIVLEQVNEIFNISEEEISFFKNRKLKRLEERIQKGKE